MVQDELSNYLESLSHHESYSSDTIIKSSDSELTEIVYRALPDGSKSGPFIRKTIQRESGIGQAYERIFEAQRLRSGQPFCHIPYIHDCYLHDSSLVVIMEYVNGETLQDLVYKQDPSLELVASVFPRLCDAVSELHEAFDPPLIHRDLKPSNIMVTDQNVVIIDFGITRVFKHENLSDTTHFGTRAYAPPEQFGYGQTTVRSDIYALGMLLFFCLEEKTPDPTTVEEAFRAGRIPEPLRDVVERATAFDPAMRYASAREMKAAVESALIQLGHDMHPFTSGAVPPEAKPISGQETQEEQATMAMATALKAPKQHSEGKPTGSRSLIDRLGAVYNTLLLSAAVISCIVSFALVFNVPESMQEYPRWFNTYGYTILMPCTIIGVTAVLLYKPPFARRFPNTFGRLKQHHYVIGFIVLATILLLATAVTSSLANVGN